MNPLVFQVGGHGLTSKVTAHLFASLSLIAISLPLQSAHSQQTSADDPPNLTTIQRVVKPIMDRGGSAQDAQRAAVQSLGLSQRPVTTFEDPEFVSPVPVTQHLRGTQGIPLPTSREVLIERIAGRKLDLQAIDRSAEQRTRSVMKLVESEKALASLPRCPRSQTFIIPVAPESKRENPVVFRDYLFLSQHDAPLEIHEKFGSATKIVLYDTEDRTDDQWLARGIGVQCLPTRVRLSTTHRYYDEGEAALSGEMKVKGKKHTARENPLDEVTRRLKK